MIAVLCAVRVGRLTNDSGTDGTDGLESAEQPSRPGVVTEQAEIVSEEDDAVDRRKGGIDLRERHQLCIPDFSPFAEANCAW